MDKSSDISHPEREGIFRYYTCEHAPWEYFQPSLNPDAPRALLVDADGWTVTVGPEMRIEAGGVVPTGRRLLSVYGDDDESDSHDLDGSLYDTDEDALRAAFEAGLKSFRVES